MKLLIVDDHAGVRAMIRELAGLPDDAVRECATGEEAVRLAHDFAPDVVTMDVRLPGLSGFAATCEICARHPAIRVVIVSADDQPAFRSVAEAAGAVGYVTKDNLTELQALFLHEKANAPVAGGRAEAWGEGTDEPAVSRR
jgi:DNA-binding NarL/FixJ family response regulator